MITIITNVTNFKFKYEGQIELRLEEPFIIIKADRTIEDKDSLQHVGTLIIDKFWIKDIESIKG